MEMEDFFAVGGMGVRYLLSSAVWAGIMQILLYNSIKMGYVWVMAYNTYNYHKIFCYAACSVRSILFFKLHKMDQKPSV